LFLDSSTQEQSFNSLLSNRNVSSFLQFSVGDAVVGDPVDATISLDDVGGFEVDTVGDTVRVWEGALLGLLEGPLLGESLGVELGKLDGPLLGLLEGLLLGDPLGPALGPLLGESLGAELGELDGPPDGEALGESLGEALGLKMDWHWDLLKAMLLVLHLVHQMDLHWVIR
jgi:hypothetical protein